MRVLTFGELLLRLASPGYTKLFQRENLEATFCGGEANVAVSLANLGINSEFVTVVPDNDVGRAAVNSMRYFGVKTDKILYKDGRMGLYYLEKGASQRPSKIIYDRAFSTFATAKREDFDWSVIFSDVDWFHWTGINPAISDEMRDIVLDACIEAKKKGIMISCDLNFRAKLWSPQQAQSVMPELLQYVDVCIANEEDAELSLGIKARESDSNKAIINRDGYIELARKIGNEYKCKYVATTLRKSYSASMNGWSAMLYSTKNDVACFSTEYEIQMVDRVGGGDSFAAGIIYGIMSGMSERDSVEFATTASCLKQTMEGDYNRATVDDIKHLVKSGGNGRVQR